VVLSQAGAGFSWFGNCQIFRLTRWEQDLVQNVFGRFVYVQDTSNLHDIWSTSYQPTRSQVDEESVTHGLGWTKFRRAKNQIETEHTVFVPNDLDGEVWLIRITNHSQTAKTVRLASYCEWHHGAVGDWHREFHRLFMESKTVDGALVVWKHAGLTEHERGLLPAPIHTVCRWIGADAEWVTDKAAFLGPEGSVSAPDALKGSLPKRSETPRWDDPIGAGVVSIELLPGESRDLAFVMGAAEDERSALSLADSVTVDTAKAALEQTQRYWVDRCEKYHVETGDPDTEFLTGNWLPYQAIVGRIYARCAYYQQGGAYGYRDQLQDSLMYLAAEPENTRLQLHRHAGAMYSDGGVKHWWMPKEGWGPDSHHSDTCLWLAYGVLEYLDATGDSAALEDVLPYLQRAHDVPWAERIRTSLPDPKREGSLLEHCLRGIDRALSLRSPRGLSLIGAGDWNDGLSHAGLDGKGESVWLSMFLFDILSRFAPRLDERGLGEVAARYRAEAESLRVAVNEFAWDGSWYIAGTRDDGKPLGSSSCEEGQIFLNPQTWAVITGIAPEDRAQTALNSVREKLVTDYGAVLLLPAYSKVDPYIGYITRYAPGLRENGGVYSHASTWAVWAFAKAGDQETARRIYRGMLPHLRSAADADLYATEPYSMPGNADGPDSPYAGRAGWTWYTGSAAWMVRLAQWLR
jgi:cellobiose phosphorylase